VTAKEHINIRMGRTLIDDLDREADRQERSRSQVIRLACRDYLEKQRRTRAVEFPEVTDAE